VQKITDKGEGGMKAEKITIGKFYRLKDSPSYTFVKAVEIIRPRTWQMKELAKDNGIKPFKFIVVKCEHVIYKDDTVGFIRYFRPADIIEG
jgi:hypothetical protein